MNHSEAGNVELKVDTSLTIPELERVPREIAGQAPAINDRNLLFIAETGNNSRRLIIGGLGDTKVDCGGTTDKSQSTYSLWGLLAVRADT